MKVGDLVRFIDPIWPSGDAPHPLGVVLKITPNDCSLSPGWVKVWWLPLGNTEETYEIDLEVL